MGQFKIQDLLMNPRMANVLPQFDRNTPLQNVYSYTEIEKRVLEYLKTTLKGQIVGDGELIVVGKQKAVLRRIKGFKKAIEDFFNVTPALVKNLRKNTKLYMPYSTLKQIEDIKSAEQKKAALNAILDNIRYNPDMDSDTALIGKFTMPFRERQAEWQKRVGYRVGYKEIKR